jgi:hypothetical protein
MRPKDISSSVADIHSEKLKGQPPDVSYRSEAIIFCPANHSPPISVVPYPGARGYEAVAICLASPEVRARTDGVIAWRPPSGVVLA